MRSPEISCESCTSACCQASIIMPLTRAEFDFMIEGGCELTLVPPFKRRKKMNARLEKACGWLTETGDCSVHEDPRRPEVCQKFQAGSFGCKVIREALNVPDPEDIFDLSGPVARLNQFALTSHVRLEEANMATSPQDGFDSPDTGRGSFFFDDFEAFAAVG